MTFSPVFSVAADEDENGNGNGNWWVVRGGYGCGLIRIGNELRAVESGVRSAGIQMNVCFSLCVFASILIFNECPAFVCRQ